MRPYFISIILTLSILTPGSTLADTIKWEGRELYTKNVHASVVKYNDEDVLKVERDLGALPFDADRLGDTVDEPTYVRLKDFECSDCAFEVKVLARIQSPSPFAAAKGFIGVTFRINESDTAFDSIYLRPNAGRSDNQVYRNHTVQYFAYPDFKFNRLRKENPDMYETYADIGLNEWITMRVHVIGERAELYLNDAKHPSFIVSNMKGTTTSGGIGLFVDIGTEGYFKDLKIISLSDPQQGKGRK